MSISLFNYWITIGDTTSSHFIIEAQNSCYVIWSFKCFLKEYFEKLTVVFVRLFSFLSSTSFSRITLFHYLLLPLILYWYPCSQKKSIGQVFPAFLEVFVNCEPDLPNMFLIGRFLLILVILWYIWFLSLFYLAWICMDLCYLMFLKVYCRLCSMYFVLLSS